MPKRLRRFYSGGYQARSYRSRGGGADVILLDIKTAEKDGFQIAFKLRYFSSPHNVFIIVMTGHRQNSHRLRIDSRVCKIQPFLEEPCACVDAIYHIESIIARA